MAKFDANSFLNQTVEKKLATKRIPMVAGDHDELQATDLAITSGTKKDGDTWARLRVKLVNTDPQVREEMKLPEGQDAVIYWEEFLDLDDEGNLDTSEGRNIKLGKLRQAMSQNTDEEWAMNDLKGGVCGGRVKWKMNDEGDPYAVLASVYNPNDDEDEDEEDDA